MNWRLKKVLLWALVKKLRSKARLKSDKPLFKNLHVFFGRQTPHRLDRECKENNCILHFSPWKRRVQKSSVNIHLLVTKTCAIQDLSPRITKTCQNQTPSSVTHMNDPYLWRVRLEDEGVTEIKLSWKA